MEPYTVTCAMSVRAAALWYLDTCMDELREKMDEAADNIEMYDGEREDLEGALTWLKNAKSSIAALR